MKTVGGKEGQWRQERKLSWGKDRRAEPGWVQLARARRRENRCGTAGHRKPFSRRSLLWNSTVSAGT